MRYGLNWHSLLAPAALAFLASPPLHAVNIVVDGLHGNDSSSGISLTGNLNDLPSLDFSQAVQTIGRAVQLSGAGDVIYVNAGVYAENILPTGNTILKAVGEAVIGDIADTAVHIVNQPNVTLDGFVIRNCATGVRVQGSTSVATLRNLVIHDCDLYGMNLDSAVIFVERCVVRDCTQYSIYVGNNGAPSLTLDRTTVVSNYRGVFLNEDGPGMTVRNCIIAFNVNEGIWALPGAFVDFNDVYSNGNGNNYTGGVVPGPNNLSVDPQFADYARRILELQPASPLVNAGEMIGGGPSVTIGAREVGYFSSNRANAWSGWIDAAGTPVAGSSLVAVDGSTGHLVLLPAAGDSTTVRSPVYSGSLKSVHFAALEDLAPPEGGRKIIDGVQATYQREVQVRGSDVAFSATDLLPVWGLVCEGQVLENMSHRFGQVQITLRKNGS